MPGCPGNAPSTNGDVDGSYQLVSRSKRKREMEQRRQEQRNYSRSVKRIRNEAAAHGVDDLVMDQFKALQIVNAAETQLPFIVHASHHAFECGGYAACLRCGFTVSCDSARNKLKLVCQASSSSGAKSRVKRLLQGKLPRNDVATWPDGSSDPRPRRVF